MKADAVAPERREAWVAQRVEEGVDVLVCHPRLVQTGLDLVEFPTICWYETDYSVYTMRQASRRSWRIGQTQPVQVVFMAYRNTLQADALQLVAKKLQSSLAVEGELPEDGLAAYGRSRPRPRRCWSTRAGGRLNRWLRKSLQSGLRLTTVVTTLASGSGRCSPGRNSWPESRSSPGDGPAGPSPHPSRSSSGRWNGSGRQNWSERQARSADPRGCRHQTWWRHPLPAVCVGFRPRGKGASGVIPTIRTLTPEFVAVSLNP